MKGPMTAEAFYARMLRVLKGRADITLAWHTLSYGKHGRKRYRFLRIASRDIERKDRILLLTTGMHGDEATGPLFMLRSANRILNAAHKAGVKVIIYPLMNPSGFELGTHYNLYGDAKLQRGNNDFLVYRNRNGEIVYDLGTRDTSELWFLSTDRRLRLRLPPETRLMHHLLGNDFWNHHGQIVGALDLHESQDDDDFARKAPTGAFHYAFVKGVFRNIVRRVAKAVPVLRHRWISDGFERNSDGFALIRVMKTDGDGCIHHYDGSLTEHLWRLNVPYAACVDTTNGFLRRRIMQLYAIWIQGMIELIRSHD
ncbi:MAG: succinylglutamate desuccinylase/aspartoacylase family protein [bacterium]|nr:succinylglutamate desuccinylase/aspartoacylase family protein [bacterium]